MMRAIRSTQRSRLFPSCQVELRESSKILTRIRSTTFPLTSTRGGLSPKYPGPLLETFRQQCLRSCILFRNTRCICRYYLKLSYISSYDDSQFCFSVKETRNNAVASHWSLKNPQPVTPYRLEHKQGLFPLYKRPLCVK